MAIGIKGEKGLSLAIAGAIMVILGALAAIFLFPKPSAHGITAKQAMTQQQAIKQADSLSRDLREVEASLASRTWKGGPQQVGPAALNSMSALAKSNQVKLSGFRPQRSNSVAGLELLPFAVTAEGRYLDVLRFVQAIEKSDSKVAVDRLQFASAEANSDQVTAVVGITAFRVTEAGS